MKGHTKIELTDVNTGKVEVIEHDNMITSAIEKELLQSNGILPPAIIAPVYSYHIPFDYIHNLFGGIFLFSNALSVDKDDYLVPFDNDMTGYSYYNITNSGKNTQLGSYSDKESGFQEDGSFKWVYNFDTSQANGKISAVALTPYVSGVLSAGIKNENFDNSKIPSSYFSSMGTSKYYIDSPTSDNYGQRIKINYSGIPIYVDNEYVYVVKFGNFYYKNDAYMGKNNKISVLKYASKLGKINPFEKYNEQYRVLEEFTINLPENFTFSNINYASFDIHDDGTFYFMCSSEKRVKGTVQLVKVDVLNKTSTLYSIKVPDNRYIKLGDTLHSYVYDDNDTFYRFCVHNNKLITYAPTSKSPYDCALYIYDMTTESETILKDFPFSTSDTNLYLSRVYNDKYFFVRAHDSESIWFIFDIETNQLKRSCVYQKNDYPTYNILKLGTRYFYFQGGENYIYLYIASPAQFLSTKNNLETPVTKTSSQSMKVTYTLTPA